LRGIMSTPWGPSFCIYDTVKKSSTWMGLNEPGNDVVVKSYNSSDDSVMIQTEGRTMPLALHTAKIGGPSITRGVAFNPSPADEARRLQAVANEVQRRRQLREQAMQGMSPGSAPPPTTVGPGSRRLNQR